MDFPKMFFCTSLSTSMDEMIKRSFKLEYRYETILEVFHVTKEKSEKNIESTRQSIEEHIQKSRPEYLRTKSYKINFVIGNFNEAIIRRISKDESNAMVNDINEDPRAVLKLNV